MIKDSFISKNLLLLKLVIGLVLIFVGFYYSQAAFIEPDFLPSASDQDFTENIIGANNANNDFNSGMVIANRDGSVIERLEFFTNYMGDMSEEVFGGGWEANSGDDGSTALTNEICDDSSDWEWFEDANGDGDYDDPEDGICVKTTLVSSGILSWNGHDYSGDDTTYIAGYECEGNFPNGTIEAGTYNGINSAGTADTTWNDGDCALCQAYCYDGKKDLPDQGAYTANPGGAGGYQGPLTPEALKNWRGTRLPNSFDFFGFCGYKDGGSDYETSCSVTISTGDYGGMVGRTDECLDLSNAGAHEWLSEGYGGVGARISGFYSCSYTTSNSVSGSFPFRAVFRP